MRVRAARVAVTVLLVICLAVMASALVLFSRSLSGIRGDFCAFTLQHYAAVRELPQVAARIQVEQSDVALLRQLGCPQLPGVSRG